MGRGRKKKSQCLFAADPIKGSAEFSFEEYTALNVCLKEAAINNLVLRVPLICYNSHKQRTIKQKGNGRLKTEEHLILTRVNNKIKHDAKHKFRQPSSNVKRGVNSVNVQEMLQTSSLKHLTQPLKSFNRFEEKNAFNNGQKYIPSKHEIKQTNKVVTHLNSTPCDTFVQGVSSQLTVNFTKLSKLVCAMKLPSPTWKITVMMNHDFATMFQFVKKIPPKCVSFSQINTDCNIVMDGVSVILLGCPKTVDNIHDIEILLEIVDRLDLRDCMVSKL